MICSFKRCLEWKVVLLKRVQTSTSAIVLCSVKSVASCLFLLCNHYFHWWFFFPSLKASKQSLCKPPCRSLGLGELARSLSCVILWCAVSKCLLSFCRLSSQLCDSLLCNPCLTWGLTFSACRCMEYWQIEHNPGYCGEWKWHNHWRSEYSLPIFWHVENFLCLAHRGHGSLQY